MRPVLAALVAGASLALPARGAELRFFDDAALHAVQFVDHNEGWAVGDDGVVWHTIDGGHNWERQPTGVRASLRALHFLNPYTGWVVGREELAPGAGSVGVILYTCDGGLKWLRAGLNTFPGLNCVHFVDAKNGFVAGDGCDDYPAGVFATTDGGTTWRPIPGPRTTAWLAAAFRDPETGCFAGAWNRLATLRGRAVAPADVDLLGGRRLSGLYLSGEHAIAAGEGGLVLASDTAGARWGPVELKLPTSVRACWDFRAVCGAGDHLWVGGRPGSAILHSSDHGKNWQVLHTGQPLPLNGLFFLDESHGWAVGEFGAVLATSDGGKTWTVQRRGNQRAAVLFVNARAGAVPLETMARLGGEEGYLTAALLVNSPDPTSATPRRATDGDRLAAAVRRATGASAEMLWQFPVPEHLACAAGPDLVKSWDALLADRAPDELLRQIVLGLRIWRPDVVIADCADSAVAGCPGDAVIAEAVRLAFARAADPSAFPEQITELGLQAWKPAKLYSQCADRRAAQVVLDGNEICTRLGATVRDFAGAAAGLLPESVLLPRQRYYRLVQANIDGAERHHDLMDGTVLAPGGTARRSLPPAEAAPELLQAIRARRNLEALADGATTGITSPEMVLGQVGPSLKTMPDQQAAETAFAIANQYVRLGQWGLARETFLLMTERYPAHPLTVEAFRWLIRDAASSEARRREELGQYLIVGAVKFEGRPATKSFPGPHGDKTALKIEGESKPVAGREVMTLSDPAVIRRENERALDIANKLAAFGPLLANDPAIQFPLQAARRNLGRFNEAAEWYADFAKGHQDGPWRDAAAAELWLANRAGPAPKPVALCRQTQSPPYLDGKLDDPCWNGDKPLALKDAVGETAKEYRTEVRLTYDKKFLYVALTCHHPAGAYLPPAKARKRDADLRAFDRVSLLLDLDRDYSTFYQLQIDQRGCVSEDCWGDSTWNPRWFVAHESEPGCWRAEAAIPLTELTGQPITDGHAWACNLVRVLPGRGVQAWSVPADVQPRPEGMGLLMFVNDPEASAKNKEKKVHAGTGN